MLNPAPSSAGGDIPSSHGDARTDSVSVTVDALVTAQARVRPRQVAVRHQEQSLSYEQLEARANQIAHALRALGVTPGDCVAMLLEPELDVPAVVLGILRVGAAYVPIDPKYPAARIAEMLEDVSPRVVISRRALQQRAGLALVGTQLLLDADAAVIEGPAEGSLELAPDPTRIATIFFTSGTTGRPKGARASHQQLSFYASAATARLGHTFADVIPTLARFGFSISIFELLIPLTVGATVLVLDRDDVMDPARLVRRLEEVTFFHAGPSLLRGVLAEVGRAPGSPTRFAAVRHASSRGDMVPPQTLSAMRAVFPFASIYVLYGCSEISCMGTCFEVPREGEIARTFVGVPFPEMKMLLLDDALRPLASGLPGEVFFAGPGVIPGYLDRPELDRESFVFIDGERFYRTGDLGRWSDAHGLELLGRVDFQLKVRGMRVESAEVEFHIRQVPGVRDVAVALRDRLGEQLLVAFVVREPAMASAGDRTALAAAIRRQLSDRVPDYMVPNAIVEIPSLPLSHNLKLDRRALPELNMASDAVDPIEVPRSATERWMAMIWCELLHGVSVGRRQNFFELGGDSLLGLQLILRVERESGVRLNGIDVLREPLSVLAALCDPVDAVQPETVESRAPISRRTSFYFGPDESLFGIIDAPIQPTHKSAVLICGPIGADDIRPSWVFSLLMRRLAERGIPAMRFDYFGTRDSPGDSQDGDPSRWRADILTARRELLARTDAQSVNAIAVRLGGTLLCGTLADADWERVVFWDAIERGDDFVRQSEQTEIGRRRATLPVFWRPRPGPPDGVRELQGFMWSNRTLEELRSIRMLPPTRAFGTRVSWLCSDAPTQQRATFERITSGGIQGRFVALPTSGLWSDPAKLLEQMPDSFVVQSLVTLVEES